MKKNLNYEEVYNRFKNKGYLLEDKVYVLSKTKMTCSDKDGYKYYVCNNLLNNNKVPEKFNRFNPYTMYNVSIFLKNESNGSKLISKNYIDSRMNLEITCEKCGKIISKKWNTIINKKSFLCDECTPNKKKYSFDFIKEEFNKNGFTILDDKYIGNNNSINCIDKDGYKIKKKYTELYSTKESYRFSYIFNKENYLYNINNYFKINDINCEALSIIEKKKGSIWVKCICECGNKFKTNISAIRDGQIRCSYCSSTMSKGEYKIRKWLDENNIEYVFQKKFEDCIDIRPLPFDFYLPKYKCCIEVDGMQHYFPSKFSNSYDEHKQFEITKYHDEIKNKYCLNNNIDLLRISFNNIRRKNKNYIEILSNKFINN